MDNTHRSEGAPSGVQLSTANGSAQADTARLPDAEDVKARLTEADYLRLFSALGVRGLDGKRPNSDGWINGLRLPAAVAEDRRASFGVNVRTGACNDFGSDFSADLFGLVQAVRGGTFPDALRWVCSETHTAPAFEVPAARPSLRRVATMPSDAKPAERPVRPAEAEAMAAALATAPEAAPLRAYLEGRGIGPELWRAYGLGFDGAYRNRDWKGPWLFIPLRRDGAGDVTHYKRFGFDPARGDWAPYPDGHPRTGSKITATGGSAVLFPDPGEAPALAGPLIVCEGELDTMTARAAGLDAFTGTAGAGTFKAGWAQELAGRPSIGAGVLLAFDGDDSGRAGARKAAARFEGELAGVPVRVATLPEGEDLNSYAIEHGRERLRALMHEAAEGPEMLSPTLREGVLGEIISCFRTAAEISREPIPEVEWIVPGLFAAGAVVQLTGPPKGAGKTTFLAHAAAAVLNGRPFLGAPCRRSPVVYLSEQGPQTLRPQYLRPAGIEAHPGLHLIHGYEAAKYEWGDLVEAAVTICRDTGARLLVVDTFAQFARLAGDEENAVGPVMEALRPLQHAAQRDNLAVVIIHHDRKGGGQVWDSGRGSSAFQAAVDAIIQLGRPPGHGSPNLREIKSAGRFADLYDGLIVELTPEGYVARGDDAAVAKAEAAELVRRVLPAEEAGALPEADLLKRAEELGEAEGIEVRKSTFGQALRAALEEKHACRVGAGKKGDPYRYHLAPDAPDSFSQNPISKNGSTNSAPGAGGYSAGLPSPSPAFVEAMVGLKEDGQPRLGVVAVNPADVEATRRKHFGPPALELPPERREAIRAAAEAERERAEAERRAARVRGVAEAAREAEEIAEEMEAERPARPHEPGPLTLYVPAVNDPGPLASDFALTLRVLGCHPYPVAIGQKGLHYSGHIATAWGGGSLKAEVERKHAGRLAVLHRAERHARRSGETTQRFFDRLDPDTAYYAAWLLYVVGEGGEPARTVDARTAELVARLRPFPRFIGAGESEVELHGEADARRWLDTLRSAWALDSHSFAVQEALASLYDAAGRQDERAALEELRIAAVGVA